MLQKLQQLLRKICRLGKADGLVHRGKAYLHPGSPTDLAKGPTHIFPQTVTGLVIPKK